MSAIDKSNPAASKQDANLKPHPTPPIVTPVDKIPLDKIKLPAGFKAEVWSHGHPGGRTMVQGPKGTMFMGTRLIGRVYAITDKDGKREAQDPAAGPDPAERPRHEGRLALRVRDQQGAALRQHRGQARQSGRAGRADRQVQSAAGNPSQLEIRRRSGRTESSTSRSARTATSARSIPASTGRSAATTPDGSGMEIVARGVRNTVGFDWHPVTKELWFTDNGRDWAGDAGPEDELNRVAKGQEGANYGFPYCHANGVPDPDIKRPNACAGVVMPAALTGPHAGGARHHVLHRQHVPEGLPERPSSPAAARGTGRRSSATTSCWRGPAGRQGQDRAVHDRACSTEGRTSSTAVRPICSR